MNVSLVMTIIGADRPGLVESLAKLVARHGGNWVESRMSRLAGQFAGILRVQIAREGAPGLTAALKELEAEGLQVTVAEDAGAGESAAAPAPEERTIAKLDLVGQDRPGIVREISRALAGRRINVEELWTECASAPMSGESLFKAKARLRIPREISLDEVRADLERVASDLLVDVTLEAE